MEVNGHLSSPAASLSGGTESLHPLDRRVGGRQSLFGRRGEELYQPFPGMELGFPGS